MKVLPQEHRQEGARRSIRCTLTLCWVVGLDAVGLYQPQVPGQEEELQELRDSGAGPVHSR